MLTPSKERERAGHRGEVIFKAFPKETLFVYLIRVMEDSVI